MKTYIVRNIKCKRRITRKKNGKQKKKREEEIEVSAAFNWWYGLLD